MSAKDTIYQNNDPVTAFVFDDKVADVFADMINRSVPGYGTIIAMIGTLAERYAQPDSVCYDLGCSLGAATLSMQQNIKATGCKIIAIDNSLAMITRCQQVIGKDSSQIDVSLRCADILEVDISNASLVVLNFTLQFVPLVQRAQLISKIYAGMKPGGMLILSEKFISKMPSSIFCLAIYIIASKNKTVTHKPRSVANVLLLKMFWCRKPCVIMKLESWPPVLAVVPYGFSVLILRRWWQ